MNYREPAYPSNELNQETGHVSEQHLGLMVFDYFAAKAMQAIIAKHGVYDEGQSPKKQTSATRFNYTADEVARIAGEYSKAMLEERRKLFRGGAHA